MSTGPRIGLVGPGWWCRHYLLPALRRAGAQVPALCGRDAARARAAARDLDVPADFDGVDAMLDAVPMDGVLITAPPSAHVSAVAAAAGRGLAVFCEKPLARDATESAHMVDACAGVPTVVGFTRRWDPALVTVKRLLDEGAVGEVRHLRYQSASVMAGDADGEWTWRYDADEYPYGVLSDLGPHAVDLVRWLVGEPTVVGAEATTVFADRPAPGGGRRAVHNWDDCVVTADVRGGAEAAHATLVLSRVLPASPYHRYHNQLDLVGTRGTIAYSSDRPVEVVLGRQGSVPEVVRAVGPDVGDAETGSFEELMAVTDHSADRQVADLLDTFDGRRPPGVPDLADGHRAQLVLDAVAGAARSRARVRCEGS